MSDRALIVLAGEVTLEGEPPEYESIVRETAVRIGYNSHSIGMDASSSELCKVKANITDSYGVYPFTIDSRNIHDANDVRFIQWEEPHWSNNRLAEFDGGPEQPIRGEKGQVAYGVLRERLSDGEWHSKKRLVGEVMEEVDVSDTTLQRIANELGVQTRRTSSIPSTTEWRLPHSRH